MTHILPEKYKVWNSFFAILNNERPNEN